mgnify:FL=1
MYEFKPTVHEDGTPSISVDVGMLLCTDMGHKRKEFAFVREINIDLNTMTILTTWPKPGLMEMDIDCVQDLLDFGAWQPCHPPEPMQNVAGRVFPPPEAN